MKVPLHLLFSSGLQTACNAGGWTLVAPFGEHVFRDASGKSFTQVFNAENCEALVSTFNGVWSRLARVVGPIFGGHACPVWLGHPDFAPAIWRERKQLGTVEGLRVGVEGLEAQLALNAAGEAAKADGRHVFPSVAVECENGDDGRIHPKLLWSIGLWHQPNIPKVDNITTINATPPEDSANNEPSTKNKEPSTPPMKAKLKALLLALGLLKEDAPDDDATLEPALDELQTSYNGMKEQLATLDADKKKAEADKATAESSVTATNAQHAADITALNATLAALRTERAELAADRLVSEGRITAAERDATVTALNCEGYAAEFAKLSAKAPVVAVNSLQLGKSRAAISDIKEARDKVVQWAQAQGGDWTTAYNASRSAAELKEAWALIDKADAAKKQAA